MRKSVWPSLGSSVLLKANTSLRILVASLLDASESKNGSETEEKMPFADVLWSAAALKKDETMNLAVLSPAGC